MIQLESQSLLWGIVGNLGGGKTMSAVKIAVEAMESGFFVVSNVFIDVKRVCAAFGEHCKKLYRYVDLDKDSPFDFPSGDPRGSGGDRRVIVVLDECAEFFDQYSSASGRTKEFMSWLRHSSKRSQDVFFVVQRQEYLAKSVRSLVSRWVWVDDLAVWRIPVFHCRVPFMTGFVMQNVFDRQGQRIQSVSFISKRFWGMFYNTAQVISNHNSKTYVYVRSDPSYSFFVPLVIWVLSVWCLLR